MKGSSQTRFVPAAGFTIVETLLVLAISSALFVAIVVTMGGRQHSTEFLQATQNLQSKIQQTLNEVAAGYYPNSNNFKCSDGGASTLNFNGGASTEQGKNEDCIFLGKIIQFKVSGGSSSDDRFNIYSIAGLRTAVDLASAKPTVIMCQSGPARCDATERHTVPYGLSVKSMKIGGAGPSIGSVGFISSLGSFSNSGAYQSGAQKVDLVAVPNSAIGDDETSGVAKINSQLKNAELPGSLYVNPANGVQICLQSGGTNQTALITIGSNGHDLAVKLEVTTCS